MANDLQDGDSRPNRRSLMDEVATHGARADQRAQPWSGTAFGGGGDTAFEELVGWWHVQD